MRRIPAIAALTVGLAVTATLVSAAERRRGPRRPAVQDDPYAQPWRDSGLDDRLAELRRQAR